MKPSRLLISQMLFICLLPNVFLSNPDSEIVQDSSEENDLQNSNPVQNVSDSKNETERVVLNLQNTNLSENDGNGSLKVAPIRNEPRSMPGFDASAPWNREMTRPDLTQSGIIYFSPGSSRGGFYYPRRIYRNNRTNLVVSGANKVPFGTRLAGSVPSSSDFGAPGKYPNGYAQRVRDNNAPPGVAKSGTQRPITSGQRIGPMQQNPQKFPTTSRPNTNPKKMSPDANLFASIVNDFTFKLIETSNLEFNFVVSPLSIFIALSMCYLGSDGNTKAQLEQALGLNENSVHEEHLHQGISDLISLISPESPEYQLLVANGMFFGKNFTVNNKFFEDMRKYYFSDLINLDFGDTSRSLSAINEWVSRSTRNTIHNIMDRSPPLATPLLLINAIYFKGIWKTRFPMDLTYNSKFHYLDGSTKNVPTMALFDEKFPFYQSQDHRHSFIKLPYAGDQVSMIIALPFTEQEKPTSSMRDQLLCYIRDAMKEVNLNRIAIPRFKTEHSVSLRTPLIQLGVSDVFNPRAANLRKLRQENDVFVSAILHKAVVNVDEEGATAAASTGVKFVPLSYRNTTSFVADHPFAFYIVHERSGLVLFYGKIFDFGPISDTGENRRQNTGERSRPGGSEVPNK